MRNFQVGIQIPGLPIVLYAVSDSSVVLVPQTKFKAILDRSKASGGITAILDNEGFSIGGESFNYNEKIFYKEIPAMLQWLKQLNMEIPTFQ